MKTSMLILSLGVMAFLIPPIYATDEAIPSQRLFAKDNLVAWCIVPFDPLKRNPEQRAAMLRRLGIKRVAYDWRAEHVPSFEAEILAYRRHSLEYLAFWGWHPAMASLIEKYDLKLQIWKSFSAPNGKSQEEKVAAAGKGLLPLVQKTRELGCKLALYNHGGWAGEPENMVAVCQWLRMYSQADHVGIVYNLHHGHGHIKDFAAMLDLMLPYLLCLNLNGMNTGAQPKILALGQGQHDRQLLGIIARSGYVGPIGILDHRANVDTEQSLRENLEGLKQLLTQMGDREALKTFIVGNQVNAESILVKQDQQSVKILRGTSEVLYYQSAPSPLKPYVKALHSPLGRNILLDSPHDHVHHHGLMMAFKVNDVDFWGEQAGAGKQQADDKGIRCWSRSTNGSHLAGWDSTLSWQDTGSQTDLLNEKRRVTFQYDNQSKAHLLTWKSRFTVPAELKQVKLTGDHYHGLGLRFVWSMDKDGSFMNAAQRKGTLFRGDERLVDAAWCAYTAKVNGKPVTVAMFGHPKNIRPTTWFTMATPFAYLSATMRYHEQELVLQAGEPLLLCYGVAVWDGEKTHQQIEQVYQVWSNRTELPMD